VAPTPPLSLVLAADDPLSNKNAAMHADDDVVVAFEQKVLDYSTHTSTYHDDLTDYTRWCDDDAKAMAILTSSVFPPLSLWV
jgi:hypothetical protein